jgi:NADPH:quinone reductase-like Zn-dependent oxidoreductase
MIEMKAVIRIKTGSPEKALKLANVEKPTPKDNEVLVKVHAATVTRGDVILLRVPTILWPLMGLVIGLKKKTIMGTEYAGEIVEIGANVTKFSVGDQVYGLTTMERSGGQTEFLNVSADRIITKKPQNMTFEEAATVPVGAMTALFLLKKKDIKFKKRVMVYGASGSVGTFAVQIAKNHGATVTGVCSTTNVDMVKSLGADQVLDYTADEFAEYTGTYDLVFDAVGKLSKKDKNRFTGENGEFISTRSSTKELVELLDEIRIMIEDGKLTTVIDKQYPLEQTIEAYKYVKTGRKKGNVVIQVIND